MREEDSKDRTRLDVWLWRARFFKTRAIATEFVGRKGVRLERGGLPIRKVDKPGYEIALGDRLSFAFGGRSFAVAIVDYGTRRGPPAEAAGLYTILS